MKYRTTEQADQADTDIFLHGAQTFGLKQAENYQDELFQSLFDLRIGFPKGLQPFGGFSGRSPEDMQGSALHPRKVSTFRIHDDQGRDPNRDFSAGQTGSQTFRIIADNPRMSRERHEFGRPVRLHPSGSISLFIPSKTMPS